MTQWRRGEWSFGLSGEADDACLAAAYYPRTTGGPPTRAQCLDGEYHYPARADAPNPSIFARLVACMVPPRKRTRSAVWNMRFRDPISSFLVDDRLCGYVVMPFKYFKDNDRVMAAHGMGFTMAFAYGALTISQEVDD